MKWWQWTLVIGGSLVLLTCIGGFIGIAQYYQHGLQSVGTDVTKEVTIVPGSSTREISKQLEREGLIRNAKVFEWYTVHSAKTALRSGTYKIKASDSVSDIVDQLAEGRVDTKLITIGPGLTLDQIKKRFMDSGYNQATVDQAFSATYTSPLLKDKPAAATLEGYVFPESYTVNSQTRLEDILNQSFGLLYQRIQSVDGVAKLQARGLTLHQGVTLASIIQKEVSDPDTQKTVAQVFYKRLQYNIPLGSDVTYMYGAKLLGVEASPTLKSPYNTRINRGLPPGPIANFNFSSFDAVLNPASTDYLYFVAGDDGKVYFAKTEAEHIQNINKYCTTACQ